MHSCQLLGFGVLTPGETDKVTPAGTKETVTKSCAINFLVAKKKIPEERQRWWRKQVEGLLWPLAATNILIQGTAIMSI